MSRSRDWYAAKAQVRVTKAEFNFENDTWTVSGYIDLMGPDGNESIVKKEFTHSWFTFGADYDALEKVLEQKCGADLMGHRRTLEALKKEY